MAGLLFLMVFCEREAFRPVAAHDASWHSADRGYRSTTLPIASIACSSQDVVDKIGPFELLPIRVQKHQALWLAVLKTALAVCRSLARLR